MDWIISSDQTKNNLDIIPCENYVFENETLGFDSEKIEDDMVFFAVPPKEIGALSNAFSSFKTSSTFISSQRTILIYIAGGVVGLIVGSLLAYAIGTYFFGTAACLILSTLLFLFIAMNFERGRNVYDCIYLGEKGIVHYYISNTRNNIRQDVLLFNGNMASQTDLTKEVHLIIDFNDYHFFWHENKHNIGFENKSFSIFGTSKDYGLFVGRKTEENWTKFLYEYHVKKEIEEKGSYNYHSNIVLYKDHFTFSHEQVAYKIDKSNVKDLVTHFVTVTYPAAKQEVPYIGLQTNNKDIIPIASLNSSPVNPKQYNCNLILYYIQIHFGSTLS